MPTTTTGTPDPSWLDYPGARDALERIRASGAKYETYRNRYGKKVEVWGQYEGPDVTILNDARFNWLIAESGMYNSAGPSAERTKFVALDEQQPTVTAVIAEVLEREIAA